MGFYKYWELLDELPPNWVIDKTVGSPLHGYEFCTNGKSLLNGQKRALVRVVVKNKYVEPPKTSTTIEADQVVAKNETTENYLFPAKVMNDLARKKQQEQVLKDIKCDMMICDIEGWDKSEYLNDLKKLINSLGSK
ncbi:MAG: hypothetical protein KDC44_14810 [Phaeodactylibacter sp.]|nr:hypothetical protein [Phaeodactylibacter sp.]